MNKFIPETISRDKLTAQVSARLQELHALRVEKQKALKDAPSGRLRITTTQAGHSHFYLVDGEHTNGTYIPEKEIAKAQAIAQKDYDKAILAEIESEIHLLEKFASKYGGENIEKIYESLNSAHKQLVHPVILPDDKYAELWQARPYKAKSFANGTPEIFTSKELRVRSKSEVIIAEKLDSEGIPFRYEYPIAIKGAGVVHPDFYCLNVRTRKEFAWEHFGLMDDPDYATQAVKKIELYAKAGYTIGDKLIATFETSTNPLNAKYVGNVIKNFLT